MFTLHTRSSSSSSPQKKERRHLVQDPGAFDHSRRHASQLVPTYGEFMSGQGDPLLQAVIDYTNVVAWNTSKSSLFPTHSPPYAKQIKPQSQEQHMSVDPVDYLIEHGSPFVACSTGMGMNDIVHLDDGTVLSIPCVPSIEKQQQQHPYTPITTPHIIKNDSPLAKLGMKGWTYLEYTN